VKRGWGTTQLDADMVFDSGGGLMTAFDRQLSVMVDNSSNGVFVWYSQVVERERASKKTKSAKGKGKGARR
jgi:hypothetical protein